MDVKIRNEIREALLKKDYANLVYRARTEKPYWKVMQSFLYESDENTRWPAIEVIAIVLQEWWQEGSRDKVKEYVRRLLWQLNEESGSMGWSAPEVIAEAILKVPELSDPYGKIMVTSALEGTPLLNSSLWAIGRLGKSVIEAVQLCQERFMAAFDSDNPETLGLAARAAGETGFTPALVLLEKMKNRREPVGIYIDSIFQEKSLGGWVEEAIRKIQ
jgi:hypothetical protein